VDIHNSLAKKGIQSSCRSTCSFIFYLRNKENINMLNPYNNSLLQNACFKSINLNRNTCSIHSLMSLQLCNDYYSQ